MVDDPLAERPPLLRVAGRVVQGGLGQPGRHGRDAEPSRVQRAERDPQSLPLGPDQAVRGQPRTVVVGAGRRHRPQPHLPLRRPERQPGQAGRHQEARDPLAAGSRPGEQGVRVGVPAAGDPGLGAGDDVAAAVPLRLAGQRGRVGTGLRLGQAVGPEHAAAEQVGQPSLLLLRGAEGGQRETGQAVHAHRDRDRGPPHGQFLQDLQVHLVRLAAAAQRLGIRQAQQARRTDDLEDLGREDPGGFRLGDAGRQLALGQLPGQVEQVSGLTAGQHPVHGHDALLATRGRDGARAAATAPCPLPSHPTTSPSGGPRRREGSCPPRPPGTGGAAEPGCPAGRVRRGIDS